MPLIEGVGDEVVQFACVVLVVVVAVLAWWSTNAHPDRYRALLIMRSRTHHPVTISIRTRSNLMISHHGSEEGTMPRRANNNVITSSIPEQGPSQGPRVIPLQEMDSIIDADMAMLDHNRLHFYRRLDSPNNNTQVTSVESTTEESEAQEESEPASNEQIREMDSIVSAMEAEVTTECDFFARPSQSTSSISTETKAIQENGEKSEGSVAENVNSDKRSTESEEEATSTTDDPSRRIVIKLKYLNDTLKEVEGSLDELLKDFKRRHFSTELSSSCRVRLIFNGRALSDEAATLRACGLHHRAVVHCLVHPNRNNNQGHTTPEEPAVAAGAEAPRGAGAGAERAWDLENILMTLVSVALTVVWFFRCEYSNMFTASASVALFGLTVFYSVAIFGLYLSDTFHLDRRPAQPQPAPNN